MRMFYSFQKFFPTAFLDVVCLFCSIFFRLKTYGEERKDTMHKLLDSKAFDQNFYFSPWFFSFPSKLNNNSLKITVLD